MGLDLHRLSRSAAQQCEVNSLSSHGRVSLWVWMGGGSCVWEGGINVQRLESECLSYLTPPSSLRQGHSLNPQPIDLTGLLLPQGLCSASFHLFAGNHSIHWLTRPSLQPHPAPSIHLLTRPSLQPRPAPCRCSPQVVA